jgi:protein-S-isoprenylcysteine O-methyltransferase Ste14
VHSWRLTVLAILGIRWVVVPDEEAAMVQKFGDAYVEYRQCTGRLLPRVARVP